MSLLAVTLSVLWLSTVYCIPVNETVCDDCCTYSDYSKWKVSSFLEVPTNQCASGYVVVEKRVKEVIVGDCHNQTEERTAECKCLIFSWRSEFNQEGLYFEPCSVCNCTTTVYSTLKLMLS